LSTPQLAKRSGAIIKAVRHLIIFAERRAHVPLPAAAVIAYGFEVVVTENHLKRTAGSGYVTRLVGLLVDSKGWTRRSHGDV
jgi:hypothetical protein